MKRERDELATLMPFDLVFAFALDARELRTVDDFREAFSGPSSRLAGWAAAAEREEFSGSAATAAAQASSRRAAHCPIEATFAAHGQGE